MTATTALPILSLANFLNYKDGTDARYELENGELLTMPPESDLNQRVASFLFAYLLQQGVPPYCLRIGAEIVVSGSRATVRLPDLLLLSDELVAALSGAPRATIGPDMPPPRLAIEIVSPGRENATRDYRYKRSQYQARGIAEYWIVDPQLQQVVVLSLVEGLYAEATFTGDAAIASALLQELGPGAHLSAARVLQAGRSA